MRYGCAETSPAGHPACFWCEAGARTTARRRPGCDYLASTQCDAAGSRSHDCLLTCRSFTGASHVSNYLGSHADNRSRWCLTSVTGYRRIDTRHRPRCSSDSSASLRRIGVSYQRWLVPGNVRAGHLPVCGSWDECGSTRVSRVACFLRTGDGRKSRPGPLSSD